MKEKITIGLFIDTFFPMIDGVCMVVDNYAKRLVKYANVIVFSPEYPKSNFDDTKLPYKVVRCKAIKSNKIDYAMPLPKLDRKFIRELNKYKLDIVHIHSPWMIGNIGINYAKKNNIPVIGTMHSQYKQDLKRAVKIDKVASFLNDIPISIFNKCDECWAVNSEIARIFHEDYKYKTMPKVMNNATDMEPVKNKDEAINLINERHNLNPTDKVFLYVGRLNCLKNIIFIADSLKILKDMKPNFNFKMLYVGTGQDEEKLKKVIESNNMQNDIILCGRVTDRKLLAKYYARADLFLFPSLYDASSIVQIEAASQLTPCLFLKGAATAATVTDNVNGFLSKNNIEEYAKKIIHIIEDKDLYNQVSENCYKDLYKNWETEVEKVYYKYLDIIGKKINEKDRKYKRKIINF